eukprot:2394104-Alexandrium_andersonii.AAC.1
MAAKTALPATMDIARELERRVHKPPPLCASKVIVRNLLSPPSLHNWSACVFTVPWGTTPRNSMNCRISGMARNMMGLNWNLTKIE